MDELNLTMCKIALVQCVRLVGMWGYTKFFFLVSHLIGNIFKDKNVSM